MLAQVGFGDSSVRLARRWALAGALCSSALLPAAEIPAAEIIEVSTSSSHRVKVAAEPNFAGTIELQVGVVVLADQLQVIDGRMIACRTANHWTPAEVLRARGRTLVQAYSEEDECSRQAACALAVFLNMQAKHQEDIGAASALRAYYMRIAIQEQLQVTDESLALIEREESRQQAIQKGGMAAGTDLSDFDRRRLEIQDLRVQLFNQDRQLQSLLAQLAKTDYSMASARQEQLDVFQNSLDCEHLKQIALATRCDIRGWKYLRQNVNETSAPVFAKMLSTMVGGFGLPIPTISKLKSLLCPPDYSDLANNMRRELDLTIETHRRWIVQAVEEKCHKLRAAYERITLAQQMIASWQARIEKLDQLDSMGKSEAEQSAAARVGLLKARAEEISRRIEARTAEVDLAEAVGGLSGRCCDGQPWLLTGS